MNIESKEKIFEAQIKPFCVRLIKDPSSENVEALASVLGALPDNEIEQFKEYLIFPLVYVLKLRETSDNLQINVLKCLQLVTEKSLISSVPIFMDIFNQLFRLLSSPENSDKGSINGSEELKKEVLLCCQCLILNSSETVLMTLTSDNFLPPFGHAIFVILRICEYETDRSLQMVAFELLLCFVQSQGKDTSREGQEKLGNVLAFFLPGISLCVTNVLTKDSKQGSKVIQKALQMWSAVLSLVLSDEQLLNDKKKVPKSAVEQGKRLKAVIRNEEWTKNTSMKLSILIEKVCSCLVGHWNYSVRLSLLCWTKDLLLHSMNSLEHSVINLVEVLLILSNDDYTTVAEEATKALNSLSKTLESESKLSLIELLEEQLYDLSTRLPRMIRTGSDSQKLVSLQLLSGYLKLLGSNINKFLRSFSHLDRLLKCLIQLTEFDLSDLSILAKRPVNTAYSPLNNLNIHKWKKTFRCFSDERIITEIQFVCRILSSYDLMTISQQLLEYSVVPAYRKQCVLLLNWLGFGLTFKSRFKVEETHAIRLLIQEYVSERLWSSHHEMESSSQVVLLSNPQNPGLDLQKSDVTLQVLLLEGLANAAKVLGVDFQNHLIECLYLILERVGSEFLVVSTAAYDAVTEISHHAGYGCVKSLIKENADYLINIISRKLRRSSENQEVTRVLTVVLQNSSEDVLLLMKDTYDEILFALDHNQGQCQIFMETLFILVSSILKWNSSLENEDDKNEDERTLSRSKTVECRHLGTRDDEGLLKIGQNLRKYIFKHHQMTQSLNDMMEDDYDKELSEKDFSRDELKTDEKETPNTEVGKQKTPTHVKITVDILKRCSHLMSSHDPHVRILVLETVIKGCHILSSHQDDLLPIIHELWPPFVERFADKKLFVIAKAFECLLTFCEVCGDFIKRRVLKSVWKNILGYLSRQSEKSSKAKASSYKFTQEYKLQFSIVKNLGYLVSQLQIQEEEFSEVCNVCLPYLHSQQPESLQSAVINLFKILIRYDSSAVWLNLSKKWTEHSVYRHKNACYQAIHFNEKNDCHYKKNISLLKEFIMEKS